MITAGQTRRMRFLLGYLRGISGGNLTELEHFRGSFKEGFRAAKRAQRRPLKTGAKRTFSAKDLILPT